jgi:hypothetical protein
LQSLAVGFVLFALLISKFRPDRKGDKLGALLLKGVSKFEKVFRNCDSN